MDTDVCGCKRAACDANPCSIFFCFCTGCMIELAVNNVLLLYAICLHVLFFSPPK